MLSCKLGFFRVSLLVCVHSGMGNSRSCCLVGDILFLLLVGVGMSKPKEIRNRYLLNIFGKTIQELLDEVRHLDFCNARRKALTLQRIAAAVDST